MFVWFEVPATIAKIKLDIHAVDMIKKRFHTLEYSSRQ